MAITKFSSGSSFTNLTKYDDFLAGNAAYDPAATWLIQRTTATGAETVITFSSIPQTYSSIQIRATLRSTQALNNVGNCNVYVNGVNTGTSYARHYVYGEGSTVSASGTASTTQMILVNTVPLGSTTAGLFGGCVVDFQDYASTTRNKTMRALHGHDRNGAGTIGMSSGVYLATTAITSVSISLTTGNWASGSTFALYGMV